MCLFGVSVPLGTTVCALRSIKDAFSLQGMILNTLICVHSFTILVRPLLLNFLWRACSNVQRIPTRCHNTSIFGGCQEMVVQSVENSHIIQGVCVQDEQVRHKPWRNLTKEILLFQHPGRRDSGTSKNLQRCLDSAPNGEFFIWA